MHKGLMATLLFGLLIAGCGGGGSGGGGGVPAGDEPFSGERTFATAPSNGAGLATAALLVRLQVGSGSRALTLGAVAVWLTSTDGTFQDTAVEVTSVAGNVIAGSVALGGGTYRVQVTVDSSGNALTVVVRRESDGSLYQGVAALVTAAGSADAALLAAATAALSELLTAVAQGSEVTLARLREARDQCAAALASGPTDPAASLGFAVTNLAYQTRLAADNCGLAEADLEALLAGRSAGQTGGDPTTLLFAIAAELFTPRGLAVVVTAGADGAAGQLLQPLTMGADLPNGIAGRVVYDSGFDSVACYEQVVGTLLPALQTARAKLAVAAASAPFDYAVRFTDAGGDTYALRFTTAEARLLAAAVDLVTGLANTLLVWHLQDTDYRAAATITAAELADGWLTPAEYCYDAPFGTLASDGAQRGQAGIAAFQRAAAQLVAAWARINSSNQILGQNLDDLDNLRPVGRALSATDRISITVGLGELQRLVAGPYTVNWSYLHRVLDFGPNWDAADEAGVVATNVPAFWANPVADLRSLLPTFEQLGTHSGGGPVEAYLCCGTVEGQPGVTYGLWPLVNGRVTCGGLVSPGWTPAAAGDTLALHAIAGGGAGSAGPFDFELRTGAAPAWFLSPRR